MKKIYLDNAATTRTDPEAVKAMIPYFSDIYGNPSSIHSFGQEAKNAMEHSRLIAADFINASPEEIIFTGSGTESDNLAIKGVAYANGFKKTHIITSAIEHHAVLESCHNLEKSGFKISYVPVDSYGFVKLDDIKKAISKNTLLISIMHANNEIGTIQPVEEIGKIARENNIYYHMDAVQTFGHINIDVDKIGVDLLSASAHKLYGPKGVGLLYKRKGVKISPIITGGSQEYKLRASTENVPGIVGFGKAIELSKILMENEIAVQTELRDKFIKGVNENIKNAFLNGHPASRLPNNINFSFDFIEGEGILMGLDMEGIAASTGSACSSGIMEPSYVIKAIGRNSVLARGSVRFSLGRFNTEDEIAYALKTLIKLVKRLRKISPLIK
ncbi:MAG: cysteine desulfurase NifS [Actinobacteria bacterium]|nr:cysteine desulfurase NifS [Actinomycetota bacterium]MBM3709758.1 cysteine desulfurase NifS [Actinomycetota bacterium]MBM3714064.1 cysteine desulfurase NifS [Actinomycetota bacterium]